MESQRSIVLQPQAIADVSSQATSLIKKQWHQIKLLPERPSIIQAIFIAQGFASKVPSKDAELVQRILKSRPTVKPIMKRRGLLPRAGKSLEEPKQVLEKPVTPPPTLPVLEPSMPVLEPSLPESEPSLPVLEPSLPLSEASFPITCSSETVTIYAGVTDTLSVTRVSDIAQLQVSCSKDTTPPLDITKVTNPPSAVVMKSNISQPSKSVPILSALLSSNATATQRTQTPPFSHHVRTPPSLPGTSQSITSLPLTPSSVSSAFKSIFDPVTTKTSSIHQKSPIKSPTAKKSTTPRPKNVAKDSMQSLISKYGIKECKVTLYNYSSVYGSIKRFGEWDSTKSNEKYESKKKDKDKNKKDSLSKQASQSKQKKKRDTSKSSDQPLAKKIKKSNCLEAPVQTYPIPKVRISLKNGLDDPMGISSVLSDSAKDGHNSSSNKENIISVDVGSCAGSEVNPKKAAWKRSATPPNSATPAKKAVDIKSVTSKALVIRIPPPVETVSSLTDKCLEKENPGVNKTDQEKILPIKAKALQLSADAVPTQITKDEAKVTSSKTSPSNSPESSQVKDKVISLKTYQARRNSLKSSLGSRDCSSPNHQGTDPAVPCFSPNGHTSPGVHSVDENPKPDLNPKLSSMSDNKIHSPNSHGQTPENKKSQEMRATLPHSACAKESPKKIKPDMLNGASTPISAKAGPKFVSNEDDNILKSPLPAPFPWSALKFMSFKKAPNNHGEDPRITRKRFLTSVTDNNNDAKCVGFEPVTSLPIDNTATAELDMTSAALQPLLDMHRQTDYTQLKVVQYDDCWCSGCQRTFPIFHDWISHVNTCNQLINDLFSF